MRLLPPPRLNTLKSTEMENKIKYWILLACCAIVTGCNLQFPHDITLSPKKLTDSIDGLPKYAPRDKEVTFSVMCSFDSVMVVKTGSKKPVRIIPCHTIGNTCTFLMPAYEVTVIVFKTDKPQPQQPEPIVADVTPEPAPIAPDPPAPPVVSPSPTPNTPVNRQPKPKAKVDSVTISFNLCLEGVYGRAVDLSGFQYKCRVAKGQNIDMARFAPRVKPEVTDVKFLGWTRTPSAANAATNFTFDQNATLYAVWQLPKPPVQAEGTPQNPIKITCIEDLKKMEGSSLCFVLATDNLVISSTVQRVSQFKGTFDGNGHRLTISSRNCFIKENRGTIQNLRLHIKSSGCHLCNNNRGTIDDITVTLEKDLKELNQAVITYTNYGVIGRRIRKSWSKDVKEPKSILYVYNR